MYVECGAVVTRSLFFKILKIDTPELTRKGKVWVAITSLKFG